MRTTSLTLLLVCLVAIAGELLLGTSYSQRLSDHRGYLLVATPDRVDAPPPRRPRRAVVVVFDGLGVVEAEGMAALRRLQRAGQCRPTHVGSLTVSRPVYAALSTGLEQHRTGARGNDATAPLAAQSVWQVARRAGLRVSAISELPWFQQLFPDGFDVYQTGAAAPRDLDFFAAAPPADLMLIHPIYIDEAGHSAGAASALYQRAVARGDQELGRLVDRLDLAQDLLLVTSDHGHTLRGGHGGQQPRVATVLTCFAGAGVARLGRAGPLRTTSIAPALALLSGLPFPAHMQAAAADALDPIFEIADSAAFPAPYLAERRAALARFRAANQAVLDRLSAPDWDALYQRRRAGQLALLGLLSCAAVGALLRHGGARGALWALGTCAVVAALQVLLRGSLDLSSVRQRGPFLRFTIPLALLCGGAALGLHALLRRSWALLLRDLRGLVLFGLLLSLSHPLVFGWTLGWPLPPAALYFFPYLATLTVTTWAVLGVLLALAGFALRGPRRP